MNVNDQIREIIILAPAFLLGLTLHEFSHGYVAKLFGDPTASDQGRLTLNPLKHLDLVGTLAFFIMKIGWAKPIPVNAAYFKNPPKDMIWVSLAGPGANFLLAIACAVSVKILVLLAPFIPESIGWPLLQMIAAGVWINIMLGVFNLLPVPPLDGSKILLGLLPAEWTPAYKKMEPFGFILLLILFYTGVISKFIVPLINFANNLLIG